MSIKTKTANGVTVHEFFCDACNVGRYRKGVEVSEAGGHKQYTHSCTHCGRETIFAVIYPMLEWHGKMFMMADALRFNMATDVVGHDDFNK
jgi:hypothetical protein